MGKNAGKRAPLELALLHHIPNGGARSKATAGRLKAEGVKAGIPDICLPVPKNGYGALYIELKVPENKALGVRKAEYLIIRLRC